MNWANGIMSTLHDCVSLCLRGEGEKLWSHLRVLVRKASRVGLLIASLLPFLFLLVGCLGEWEALRFLLGVVVVIGFGWELNLILTLDAFLTSTRR